MRSRPNVSFPGLLGAFIRFLILALVFNASFAADRPNLIFILTDDQRYDTLGVTGDKFISTPNLD